VLQQQQGRRRERLVVAVADDEAPLGPGLYGPSLFYRSVEKFYAFNVCNHWVARLLSAAGLPTAPVLATLPQGLFFDLKWRVGLVTLPKY